MSFPDSLVWLITGTSSGLGLEIARAALASGQRVIATARNPSKSAELAQLSTQGAQLLALDVTAGQAELDKKAAEAINVYGQVDVLVNNAGYILQGAIEECSHEEIYAEFNTCLFGAINLTRSFLPHLRNRGSGIIVNLGTLGGWRGVPNCAAYCASKMALSGFNESLNAELNTFGIRAVLLEVGYTRTNFLSHLDNIAARRIPEYDPVLAASRQALVDYDGKQPGNPAEVAKRTVEIVTGTGLTAGKELPVRVSLGSDAYTVAKEKCEKVLKELEEWKEFSFSTDF